MKQSLHGYLQKCWRCIAATSTVILLVTTGANAQFQEQVPAADLPPTNETPAPPVPTEPTNVPLEPAPLFDQQSLLPVDTRIPTRPPQNRIDNARAQETEPNRREILQTAIAEPESNTAASTFGFDTAPANVVGPTGTGTQAERERDKIIARAEKQANLQHYNVKIGPIPFRFGAGLDIQATDNVNISGRNKQADLIAIPHLDIYGGIQLTSHNVLSIEFSLGYLWDMNRGDQSRSLTNASVGLDSDAGLSLDLKMGNFRINLHERPSIPRQQFDLITQRSPIQYSQFVNVAGVSVFWDMNSRVSASFQYDHFNAISLKSEAESLDQSSEQFSATVSTRISDSMSLGIQASGSIVKYDRGFLNDASNISAGVSATLKASKTISIRSTLGYQIGRFGSQGSIGDSSNLNDWYASLELTHNVNSYLNQIISIGRESQNGRVSNSTSVAYIRHQMNLAIVKNLGLGTHASYELAEESGGQFAQKFTMMQFGIFSYLSLSKKLTLSLQYRYIRRDANGISHLPAGDLSYAENRLDIGFQYPF